MRPEGTAQQLQRRRQRAIELLKEGKSYRAVADRLGASLSSVVRWQQACDAGGRRALDARPHTGRPCRLSPHQQSFLRAKLQRGALAAGYDTDLWTLKRIRKLIEKLFRIHYHPCHVWRLMQAMGWSCQKPERQASQRNDRAIARWRRQRWPYIKKSPRTWGPSRLLGRERLPVDS